MILDGFITRICGSVSINIKPKRSQDLSFASLEQLPHAILQGHSPFSSTCVESIYNYKQYPDLRFQNKRINNTEMVPIKTI